VIAFHHPPVDLHCWIDRLRQTGEDRLAAVVRRHDNVVALVCGHAHTAAATTFAGLPLLVAPGVSSTVVLPWEDSRVVDEEQPAGVAFHVIGDDRRVTTHFRSIV
jgi:Icc-related predicted phosphoesterase